MNPKKNRVVETPHSLRINGHFIPWVTKVKVDNPGSPTDELREITVTFVAGSYHLKSRDELRDRFSDRGNGYRNTLGTKSSLHLFLKRWFGKCAQVLMASGAKALNRK